MASVPGSHGSHCQRGLLESLGTNNMWSEGPHRGVRRPRREARAAAALQLTRTLGGAIWGFIKP